MGGGPLKNKHSVHLSTLICSGSFNFLFLCIKFRICIKSNCCAVKARAAAKIKHTTGEVAE